LQPAGETTVLGDFSRSSFSHFGVRTTFSSRKGKYIVRTDGPDAASADVEGKRVLQRGLDAPADQAGLHHALGLNLARQKRMDDALAELKRGLELAPGNPRFAYIYGVALLSAGRKAESLDVLKRALDQRPATTRGGSSRRRLRTPLLAGCSTSSNRPLTHEEDRVAKISDEAACGTLSEGLRVRDCSHPVRGAGRLRGTARRADDARENRFTDGR